jgi:hypothetical protein
MSPDSISAADHILWPTLRLRKAYADDVGQEFTVEYLGHPYYRFRPTSIPQEDQFVFALFAKERFRTLLQKI